MHTTTKASKQPELLSSESSDSDTEKESLFGPQPSRKSPWSKEPSQRNLLICAPVNRPNESPIRRGSDRVLQDFISMIDQAYTATEEWEKLNYDIHTLRYARREVSPMEENPTAARLSVSGRCLAVCEQTEPDRLVSLDSAEDFVRLAKEKYPKKSVIYDETVLMAVLHPCTQTSPDIYIHARTHSVICNGCLENQINMPCYGVLTSVTPDRRWWEHGEEHSFQPNVRTPISVKKTEVSLNSDSGFDNQSEKNKARAVHCGSSPDLLCHLRTVALFFPVVTGRKKCHVTKKDIRQPLRPDHSVLLVVIS
ncbi:Melanoregulin Dilute suppressor protein -like protein [Collichthys lucidus]|uniref:Melanoregulin Dilute suppressor protein-like protein n=1 Tax=Collichthys lucidus TaxID=240159 RepID=A0A4U5U0E7_COLLU|nr:Melanoregulin Dilute suppressor protein -like protein [Collichthys lucidus]